MGTIDRSCLGVSGCASGSDLAAAVIARSSAAVGIATTGGLEALDIVLHLSTIGSAQADDPAHVFAVYKGHVVEDTGLRREGDGADLVVVKTLIDPHQGNGPVELACESQGDAMFGSVRRIFGRVELDAHALL